MNIPSLPEWKKENPEKSINDYFSQYPEAKDTNNGQQFSSPQSDLDPKEGSLSDIEGVFSDQPMLYNDKLRDENISHQISINQEAQKILSNLSMFNLKKIFFITAVFEIFIIGFLLNQNNKKNNEIQELFDYVRTLNQDLETKNQTIVSLRHEVKELNEKLSDTKLELLKTAQVDQQYIDNGFAYTGRLVQTQIDGAFRGWNGETIFSMVDGSVWKQAQYDYLHHYDYRPNVTILRHGTETYMQVEGIDRSLPVVRLR